MNMQEIIEKWMMNDRDSTPMWRLSINEIEYEPTDDPSDGVEIAALAENIRQCGLIHPILVERQRSKKRYRLISGRRRIEALLLLGRTHVCAIVVKSDELEPLKISLSENFMRKKPHFLDFASDMQTLLKNYSVSDVAKLFSVKEEYLESRLTLTSLSAYEKRLIRLLKLTENQALDLCAIENSTLRKLLLEKMLESGDACDRTALISQAVKSPDFRLTQSEKIFVRDIRVFLNTVERAAEVMQSAGFATEIKRIDRTDSYQFTITVSKSQYLPLNTAIADKADVSRETLDNPKGANENSNANVSRETSKNVSVAIDESAEA